MKISEQRLVTIRLGLFAVLICATVTATMGWASVRNDVLEAKGAAAAATARIAVLESSLSDIRELKVNVANITRDVDYIRRTMDEDRRRRSPGQ